VRRERPEWYEVHEVLRQYGLEKLAQVPTEEIKARDRHSAYFTSLLQQSERALKGADQMGALEEIGTNLQNVRTAWRWAVKQGKVAEIRNAAPSLWLFYEMHGLLEEGEQAFGLAVARLEAKESRGVEEDLALGLTLALQGRFAGRLYRFGDAARLLRRGQALLRLHGAQREWALANSMSFYPGAEECFPDMEQLLQESLTLFRSLGDRWGVTFALSRFLWSTRQHADARQQLKESLAISRESGDRWTVGLCLFQLGQVLERAGAHREAKQRYQESLAVFHDLGDRHMEQMTLDHTGYEARALGEYEDARQYHLESLAISREEGDRLGIAGSLDNLGLVACELGDYEEAEWYFQEGLAIRTEVGHRWAISVSLAHLGDVALAQGNTREARRRYRESLEAGRGVESLGWLAVSLKGLGEVCTAEGDFEQARQHFRDTLEQEMGGQAVSVPLLFEVLLGAAQLAGRMGKSQKSAEWLAYVAGHTASSVQMRERAKRILNDLASRLPPDAMAAARERSRDRTPAEVVQAVLQQL